jgi:hypothetical protein
VLRYARGERVEGFAATTGGVRNLQFQRVKLPAAS